MGEVVEFPQWNATVAVDISKTVDSLVSEIDSELNMKEALQLYIHEVLQSLISEGNLFRGFIDTSIN